MKLPAPIRRLARRVRGSLFPGGLILLYHRVTRLPTDPQWLTVTPEHFAAHLDLLRRVAVPLPLTELAERAKTGRLPRRAVAVTFDDGYADNLLQARPILAGCGIPATVFVAGTGGGAGGEFFWDELERLLLQPGKLPAAINIRTGKQTWTFGAEIQENYSVEDWEQARGWNLAAGRTANSRQQLYRELCSLVAPLDGPLRQEILEQVRSWAGAPSAARDSHRRLTPDELRKLAAGGAVEVGGHTLNHPVLAMLSRPQQEAEIVGNKRALEDILGRPVCTFAYPFGGCRDYTPQTVEIVRESGFAAACANVRGGVRKNSDPHQLPRVLVRDWDADMFAAHLEEWFND